MILKIRIDDRLLHGQVAYSWKAALAYNAIVIVSDAAANDELRKATLKMCCPDGVKLATRTIAQAKDLLNNPKLEAMKVFVVAPDPQTVLALVPDLKEKPVINLGSIQMHEEAELFSKAVYLNKQDKQALNKLVDLGYRVEIQEVPDKAVSDYKSQAI